MRAFSACYAFVPQESLAKCSPLILTMCDACVASIRKPPAQSAYEGCSACRPIAHYPMRTLPLLRKLLRERYGDLLLSANSKTIAALREVLTRTGVVFTPANGVAAGVAMRKVPPAEIRARKARSGLNDA